MSKTILIIIGLAVIIITAIPHTLLKSETMNPEDIFARKGGLHLVLRVDDSGLEENERESAIDRIVELLRERIKQYGLTGAIIERSGGKRISVRLPELKNHEDVAEIIGRTAMLEFRLIREFNEIEEAVNRLDESLAGVTVIAGNSDVPASDSEKPFSRYIRTYYRGSLLVEERNVEKVNKLIAAPEAQGAIPSDSELMWFHGTDPLDGGGSSRRLYLVDKSAALDGSTLENAQVERDPDTSYLRAVHFTLNQTGAKLLSQFTGSNIGRFIAITIDRRIYSAPIIVERIPTGEGAIYGLSSESEANNLAILLRAGALPAPVTIVEVNVIEPNP